MNTNLTTEQITAIATEAAIAAVRAVLSAPVDLAEPAAPVRTSSKPAKPAKAADAPVVLTRARWKALSHTKAGVKRAKFAGMNREQALEAGLLPGYVLPTGAMRELLGADNA